MGVGPISGAVACDAFLAGAPNSESVGFQIESDSGGECRISGGERRIDPGILL